MNTSSFHKTLADRCRPISGHAILPEASDPRTLQAVEKLLVEDAICGGVTLIGSEKEILDQLPSSLRPHCGQKLKIRDCHDPALVSLTADIYRKLQQARGKTPEETAVRNIAHLCLYQAGALLESGQGDCVVAGAVATTADVIRAALGTVGLAPGIRTVSGGFFLERTGHAGKELFYYADAGVVIEPTLDQLVDIAMSSCDTWTRITKTPPVVAFLSFSTKGSAVHPWAEKMKQAHEMFRTRCPHIESDGELQFDAAYVASVGERKAPDSKVPGRANVFIFPDLGAANIAYKITQRLGGFGAYGPILQGLNKPYSDLSRGASAEDIAVSVMINLLRSKT